MTIPRACIVRGSSLTPCSDGGRSVPGTSRCRNHMYKGGWGKYIAKHPERAAFYRSPAWRAMREAHLAANPNCVCGQPANHVDHVVAISLGGRLDGRLQSLCAKHHHEKTVRDSHEGAKRAAARRKNA